MTTRYQTATQMVATVKVPGAPSLSSQFTWNEDFNPACFIDLAKSARGWFNIGGGGSTDSDANLTGMSGTGLGADYFFCSWKSRQGNGAKSLDGVYVFRWKDNGSGATVSIPVGLVGVTQAQTVVSGQSDYDREFRADIVFGGNMILRFSGINGATPPSDVTIVREDDISDFEAGALFQPRLIEMFKDNLYSMRFMSWCSVWGNYIQITDYADWPQESRQTWNGRVPVSVMCKLCNELNAHLWINLPISSPDALFTAVASEIQTHLRSDLLVMPEFSNENWNDGVGGITADLIAGITADWPSAAPYVSKDYMSWCGYRSTKMVDAFDAVLGASRVRGILGGWQNGSGADNVNVWVMDAPTWNDVDPDNYIAPHTRHSVVTITDYFGKGQGLSDAVMSLYDSGEFGAARNAMRAYYESQIAGVKNAINNFVALRNVPDSVNGTTRSIQFGFYEGGSNHSDPIAAKGSPWYYPPNFTSGMSLLSGQYVRNPSTQRIYQSQTEGTAGNTAPSHLTGSTAVVDGITWLDLTGQEIALASSFTLRRNAANGTNLSQSGLNVQPFSAGSVSVDDYVETSAGRIYRVAVAGTASAEPTHISGTDEVSGVSYEFVEQYLGERNMRPEVFEWLRPYMMGPEMARQIIDLWEHAKSAGMIMPNLFIPVGTIDEFGFFPSSVSFDDQGKTKTYDRGEIVRAWSRATPVWWTL